MFQGWIIPVSRLDYTCLKAGLYLSQGWIIHVSRLDYTVPVSRLDYTCLKAGLYLTQGWIIPVSRLDYTVKSGNFVMFFTQNIFSQKVVLSTPTEKFREYV